MRIAEVAPLHESVPPRMYGGTERVVSFLVEELVRQGHEVTLFASGDSVTRAELVPIWPRGLRLDGRGDPTPHHVRMVDEVVRRARAFDLVHFHIEYVHVPLLSRGTVPYVTTLHGRLDRPEVDAFYRAFPDERLIAVSRSQQAPLPHARWVGAIHHGLPADLLPLGAGRGGYLAFLGRVSVEKRLDRAIDIARRVGLPLRVAAKIDRADEAYYRDRIRPMLGPDVELVGEIGEAEKPAFLGNAAAMLFPIDWPEPFGLVMIEAMACGTPVVAFRGGAVDEVIEDGVSGFVVDDLDQAVAATKAALTLSRVACRRAFERRFLVSRMAEEYTALFERVVGR